MPDEATVIITSYGGAWCLTCNQPAEAGDTAHWNQGGLDRPEGCKVTFTHIAVRSGTLFPNDAPMRDPVLFAQIMRPDLTCLGEVDYTPPPIDLKDHDMYL